MKYNLTLKLLFIAKDYFFHSLSELIFISESSVKLFLVNDAFSIFSLFIQIIQHVISVAKIGHSPIQIQYLSSKVVRRITQ